MKNHIKRVCITIYIVLQTLLIVSCGGGGSSSGSNGSTPTGPSNTTPTTPTVSMVQPTNNATNASISQVIELSFSEPVTNVTESTVTLHESSPTGITVPTTDIVLNGDGKSYTFSSTSHLIPSTKYYVVVGSGIKSVSGNIEVAPTNFNFQTSEYASPTVNMTNPGNGATDVSTSQIIALQFSESVSNVTESTVVLHEGGPTGKVINTSITAVDASNYTFQPESLSGGTTYYVEVTNQITSTATGESLTPAEFSFTTSQSITAPTVVMLNPSNNGTIESLIPEIRIQFSESVTGVSTSNIFINAQGTSFIVPITSIKAESNNVYAFFPKEALNRSTSYAVNIGQGIKSVSTGQAVVPTFFIFTVLDAPTFAYITAYGKSPVNICKVNLKSGDFENCHPATWTIDYPYNVTVDPSHQYVYLTGSINNVEVCPINRATGNFTDCQASLPSFSAPTGLAFSPTGSHVYVVSSTNNINILMCSVDTPGSVPGNCQSTGSGFKSPRSIVVDKFGKQAYISNSGDKDVVMCSIDNSTESLVNCAPYKDSTFDDPRGLAISSNGKNLYVANTTQILSIGIDAADGSLGLLNIVGSNFGKLIGIASSQDRLYFADYASGAITHCLENVESGSLELCHSTSLAFPDVTGIAILSK